MTNPNFVVVLDATLIETNNVTAGVPEDGIIVVNTPQSPAEMAKQLGLGEDAKIKVFTVDADTISKETIGRVIPNTPMLGALIRATGVLELEDLLEDTKRKLEKKFRNRPEIIQGNLEAIRRAYQEVK